MAKSKHRKKTQSRPSAVPGNLKVIAGLQMADELMDDGKMNEARQVLETLHRQHPSRGDVMQNLAYACHQLGDLTSYLTYCEKLVGLSPKSAENLLALATAYAMNFRPMLALRVYRDFLAEWPDHEEAPRIRQDVVLLETNAQSYLAEAGLAGEEGLSKLMMHEEIQVMLSDGRYKEGETMARKLIANHPQFAPAHNNLSLMFHLTGRIEEAIAVARHVLSFDPDNFQATGNLARYLFLNGQSEESVAVAARFKEMRSDNPDFWVKQAETFSYLGDDEAVLTAFRRAEKLAISDKVPNPALIYHLAAVASARLENESDAKRYWNKALALSPGFELARKNLEDLKKPIGERHGAWAYDLGYWLPRATIEDLIRQMHPKKTNDTALKRIVENFLRSRSDLRQLIPLLLERCDPAAVELVLMLANVSQNPELMETVKNFALGQRGSDQQRFQAAQMAVKAGLLPSGEICMWSLGKQTTFILLNTEITGEPVPWKIPPQARQLAEKAMKQLQQGRGYEAEQLLNQALKLAPGDIRLRNNLAATYKLQRRTAEYERMIEQIYAEDPDYFFACAQMAELLIERGQTEEATRMIIPLSMLKKMHFSEMAMLCTVHIELALKEGRRDTARSWLDIFERVYPDHHNVKALRFRVEGPRISDLLGNPFRR